MRIARQMSGLAMLDALSACATARVSYRGVARGKTPVSAQGSKFDFLGVTPTPMERLTQLRDTLNAQCGDRGVTGIVAKTSTVFAIVGVIEASFALPPIRLAMLLKPPLMPVTVPLSRAVIVHRLATLSAVRVLVPLPPFSAPPRLPPLSVKLSSFAPPVRLPKPLNN